MFWTYDCDIRIDIEWPNVGVEMLSNSNHVTPRAPKMA